MVPKNVNLNYIFQFSTDDESVEDNPVIRCLCPEKQAVNTSEFQYLLNYDSLQKIVQQEEKAEFTSDKVEQNISCTPPNDPSIPTTASDSNEQAVVNKTLNSEESKDGKKPKEGNNIIE